LSLIFCPRAEIRLSFATGFVSRQAHSRKVDHCSTTSELPWGGGMLSR
jgi:hypothetical protein